MDRIKFRCGEQLCRARFVSSCSLGPTGRDQQGILQRLLGLLGYLCQVGQQGLHLIQVLRGFGLRGRGSGVRTTVRRLGCHCYGASHLRRFLDASLWKVAFRSPSLSLGNPFQCVQCNKCFNKGTLEKHLQKYHAQSSWKEPWHSWGPDCYGCSAQGVLSGSFVSISLLVENLAGNEMCGSQS